jgi:uncharacterized protein (UPF0333 family)
MSEKKIVDRTVLVALGIILVVLIAGIVGIYGLVQSISNLDSNVKILQSQNSDIINLLRQAKPYVHSQLLSYGITSIPAYGNVSGWILDWNTTGDVRVVRIQVWMGNPANVTWEGDTWVTVGKPDNLTDSNSYNYPIQLLVHYQFDNHAPSSVPHQLMFDLGDGFEVLSGQTINVWRLFNNIEPYTVYSGDVQVIIYYEYG